MLTLAPAGLHALAAGGLGGQMTIAAALVLQKASRLPAADSVVIGVLALIAVVMPGLWALVRGVNVVAHEGAHALTGSTIGGRVAGVVLKANGTGATAIAGAPGSGILVALVGYFGPSAFGLAAAALAARGLAVLVLWSALLLLVILVFSVRNLFGLALVAGFGFLLFSVARSADARAETLTAYALSWVLLLSGIRVVLEHGIGAVDAHILRSITHLPRILWHGLWLIGSVAALVYGWRMLV